VEKVVEYSGTPYFAFKDIDENKPAGSIKLRVETIDYFLKQLRKQMAEERKAVGRGQWAVSSR
jgi:predicted nucleotide-binding protein (sugar kinase/HSP70/actin superfamily)